MRDTSEPGLSFHPAARRVLRFGPFRIDLSDGSLWRGDEEVRMPPRALALLLYLIERPGRVVSKAELMDAVWKDANVSETSLTEALGIVRQALGDSSQQPEYIQTVHRRGYRFIAAISVDGATTGPRAVTAGAEAAPTQVASPTQAASSRRVAPVAAVAAAALIVVVSAAALWSRTEFAPRRVTRAAITLPSTQAPPASLSLYPIVAISPDGREMVYVAGNGRTNQLFVRRMDQFEARAIPGTDGAHAPFFSPDGERVGFFAGRTLKHVPIAGGEAVTVTDASGGLGGAWTKRGTIIFAPDWTGGLLEVDEKGGSSRVFAAAPGNGYGYRWPQALSDGETVIATRWRADQQSAAVVLLSRSHRGETLLAGGATAGSYLPDGDLVFARNGVLFVAPFTPGTPPGPERQVLDGVMTSLTGATQYSVSRSGSLVYVPHDEGRNDRRLMRVDFQGNATPLSHDPRAFQEISVCGDLLAVSIIGRSGFDVWTGRLSGGALTRLTSTGSAMDPVWRPGCSELAYSSGNELYLHRADGAAPPVRLQPADLQQAPSSWSTDGTQMVYVEVKPETRADIWTFDVASKRAQPLVRTNAVEWVARVAPNGRWVAYQSNETGRYEVYVRPLAGQGGLVQVSPAGGTDPSWSPDGRTLFFLQKRTVVAARFDPERGVPSTELRELFQRPALTVFLALPDGKSFLVADRIREHQPITTMNLVVNWAEEVGTK